MSHGIVLTEWLMDDHGSLRAIAGTDPNNIANRVAFIEKTPRVRVAPFIGWPEPNETWRAGPKGSAPEYGRYQPSRDWCDRQLLAMGYVLPPESLGAPTPTRNDDEYEEEDDEQD